nr:MAG TPA: hypothetical protein [Caudoviricetes sp.]
MHRSSSHSERNWSSAKVFICACITMRLSRLF